MVERILSFAFIEHFPLEETIFVTDGPLAVFKPFGINPYFLESFQGKESLPILMGLEKTGLIHNFASLPQINEKISPGSIVMVTKELLDLLVGGREGNITQPYFYGKRFIYKTKDGSKTFVLMALPQRDNPYPLSEKDRLSDHWDNYPHLHVLCEYIEENLTDSFGREQASLDIIAEANHAASLPKKLSEKFLSEIVKRIN
jgi:hypothetical protein